MNTARMHPVSTGRDGRLDAPFYQAKFRPPTRPRHFVARPRLEALLDDLADYPIAAIVAPAGAGKTVLAADWVVRSGRACGWLTLDAADRSATELSSSLATALDLASADAASPRGGRAATLVLDNVDRVGDDPAAQAALASFVDRRPPWLQLLLLSRRRPPLPVDRLRVSGDLADIDFATLRFSEVESASLLTALCPGLAADEMAAAVERANGWAAALQLTALAIRSHRFTAAPAVRDAAVRPEPPLEDYVAERLVEEYLWEEVLQSERAELVELLHATAVVGRINYGLAEALTERADAGDLLDEAEAAGLFLTALQGGWFEVHSLVREMLTARLHRRQPDGLRKQHARAAQWFESLGDEVSALEHWLAAQRPTDALRVLSELTLALLDSGHVDRAADAIGRLPAELASASPDDAIRYVWCRLPAGAGAFVDALSVAESSPALREGSSSRLRTLDAVASWLRADWRDAADGAARALSGQIETAVGEPLDRFGWRMVACGTALDERWDDRQPAVGQAWAACLKDPASRWFFESTRALGLALAGHPREAARVADGAREATASGPYGRANVQLTLADAVVAREVDRREAARTILDGLAEIPTYPDPVLQLVARLELLRQRMDAGDTVAAAAHLDEAERLHAGLASTVSAHLGRATAADEVAPSALVARAGVDVALASDDPATAIRWVAHVSDPFWGPVCEAKIDLALGRHEDAAQAVRRAAPRCARHQVVAGLVLGRALAVRHRDDAEQAVAGSLETAAGHGMIRTVAFEGAPVIEIVERAAWRVPDGWMDRLRHALVPTWTGQDPQLPVERLTERERDVLRLLPSRLTLTEIASELYVSQNTLKFHLRGIYRKLGADSRSQAVTSARRMRLLPHG
ncbi:LuxR C-terminal-related transcriptional regulator [Nocardioides sp. AN3]